MVLHRTYDKETGIGSFEVAVLLHISRVSVVPHHVIFKTLPLTKACIFFFLYFLLQLFACKLKHICFILK